jgi:hypothetical protein
MRRKIGQISNEIPWSTAEEHMLARLWATDAPVKQIASIMDRSIGSIVGKRKRMGLPERTRGGMKKDEVDVD